MIRPVLWPSPVLLIGSGWGSHKHAQLVDILAQRREVRQFSCCRTAASLKVSDRILGATSFASSPNCYFMLLFDSFMTDCSKGSRKRSFERWQRGYDIVLWESSLSFQFPSHTQIAVVSLVCALRCLCSRSLACVTSFPLPVQPMLIITPVFQTPLFPGDVFKNFQIHIPIR